MPRFRRYRVFIVFAALITFILFRLSRQQHWDSSSQAQTFDYLTPKEDTHGGSSPAERQRPADQPQNAIAIAEEPVEKPAEIAVEKTSSEKEPPPAEPNVAQIPIPTTPEVPKSAEIPTTPETPATPEVPTVPKVVLPIKNIPPHEVVVAEGEEDIHPISPPGRQEFPDLPPAPTIIHWEKQKEHFPVPTESIIQLPTGRVAAIPRIQHVFKDETPDAKINREKRQAKVKVEFQKAWAGYKEHAWLHDELSPVSGKFRDPFCGWAATLVDSLDTLWIMGLHEEFEEAVRAVDLIDFTTSPRQDIPMFETTIRYLGGLLAAYDVSESKYRSLLDKAVELAEILMGAFDTPNRMPVLYYNWKPAFASQPHRASQRSNTAELGSLSMEFTRLAQLTGNPVYYDAVARVTNALSDMQDRGTPIDGAFPDNIDASGCNRTKPLTPKQPLSYGKPQTPPAAGEPEGYALAHPNLVTDPLPRKRPVEEGPGTLEMVITPGEPSKAEIVGWEDSEKERDTKPLKRSIDENALSGNASSQSMVSIEKEHLASTAPSVINTPDTALGDWDCVSQGLEPAGPWEIQSFSMGGGQDSTYEYFPKQFLLLGGREKMYRKMYLKTIDAVRNWMLFRPMLPDNRDVLFSGQVRTAGNPKEDLKFTPEVTHLTCFIGGMVGMGAKIFDIEGDLELAKKLTDGCVWAYESLPSGIMPEDARTLPCKDAQNCNWNETVYWEALDVMGTGRDKLVEEYIIKKAKLDAEIEAAKIIAAEKANADEQAAAMQGDHMNNTHKVATDAELRAHDITDFNTQRKSSLNDIPDVNTEVKAKSDDTPSSNSLQKRQSSPREDLPKPITHNFRDDVAEAASTAKKADAQDDTPNSSSSGPFKSTMEKVYVQKEKENNDEFDDIAIGRVVGDQTEFRKPIEDEIPDPNMPLTHKQWVEARIKRENIPPGFVDVRGHKYILRPEAIESVWYMYRITGDTTWQEKGWKMFESIIKATSTPYGNSAIYDVAMADTQQTDEMESFWLAETLKYFYLLYSTPDTISLDDWVLNTEAHPFKRPTSA
ncbi:hypothetical protein B7494_g1798 [Chlorociboria aeruginascens]|nr:hypothetical protein B7494_g1798 [Chlorociboria aeruginascens]